ncbi:hypothetical protein C8R44DRAFT_196227 [Mycena epipterygia]|nr:hypothetical protein C8R44DRAFT_196227 [Mycena epipterygia]
MPSHKWEKKAPNGHKARAIDNSEASPSPPLDPLSVIGSILGGATTTSSPLSAPTHPLESTLTPTGSISESLTQAASISSSSFIEASQPNGSTALRVSVSGSPTQSGDIRSSSTGASQPTSNGSTALPVSSISGIPTQSAGIGGIHTQSAGISGIPTQAASISSSSTATSQSHASTALRSLSHMRTVIAISVSMGVLLIIVLITLVFWLRRRRRSTGAAARRKNGQANIVSPFILVDSHIDVPQIPNIDAAAEADGRSISASTRRQHLENQLRAAREKMADIADLERSTAAAAVPPPSAPRRFLRLVSTRSTSQRENDGGQDLASELEAARARIHELEAHMNSEWALGLSDEPPPGYTA